MLPVSRRHVLQVVSGLGVSFLVPGLSLRAAQKRGPERPRSLITLWMAGGQSQLEAWDPHPGTKIGGPTKAISTNVPGLQISEHYPRMAEHMSEVCLTRSMVSKEGDHERATYMLKTGFRPDPTIIHPSLGAILADKFERDRAKLNADTTLSAEERKRLLVEQRLNVDIPVHVSVVPGQWPARGGYLGDQYDAFKIYDPNQSLHNMQAGVKDNRQSERLEGLNVVEQAFSARRKQARETLHQETVRRALTMMASQQLRAFKIENEPKEVRAAYGDTSFGQGCLVARRLVEEGVRAVEVTLDGFDTHADNFTGQRNRGKTLDPAFAALLTDLKQRDLLASTIVMCIGEFGRTPAVNPLEGRDHWPTGFSTVLAGGGFKPGLLVGSTDPAGKEKQPADPIEVRDLYATILSQLGVDCKTEHLTPIGRPMRFSDGTPVERLLA
jgi:hypothetical protein